MLVSGDILHNKPSVQALGLAFVVWEAEKAKTVKLSWEVMLEVSCVT